MPGMILSQNFLVRRRWQSAPRAIGKEDKIDREDEENRQEDGLYAIATARTLQAAAKEEHGVGRGLVAAKGKGC